MLLRSIIRIKLASVNSRRFILQFHACVEHLILEEYREALHPFVITHSAQVCLSPFEFT